MLPNFGAGIDENVIKDTLATKTISTYEIYECAQCIWPVNDVLFCFRRKEFGRYINCCKRTVYCNDSKITEFDMIDTKNSSNAYVVMYKLIT